MSISPDTPIPIFAVGSVIATDCITPLAHHVVETSDWTLFRGPGIYSEALVRKAAECMPNAFRITHAIRADSTLKFSIIHDALRQIVAAHNHDLNRAKKAIVKFIGLFAQSVKRHHTSYVIPQSTSDSSSLFYYYLDELSRGREVNVHPNWCDIGHHVMTATALEKRTMNAGPVHRMILNRSFEIIYDYMQGLSEHFGWDMWRDLSGIKTDCLLFRREFYWAAADGMLKIAHDLGYPVKIEESRLVKCCNITRTFDVNTIAVKQHQIIRETDHSLDEITEMIIEDIYNGLSVRIEGFGGTGKTTLARDTLLHLPDLNPIPIAVDWVSAQHLSGQSVHTQFKLGETTDGWYNRIKNIRSRLPSLIILDESGKADNDICAVLNHVTRTSDCVFVAIGNHSHQKLPIKTGFVDNEDSINAMVDKIYMLSIVKRADDTHEPAIAAFDHDEIGNQYNRITYEDYGDLAKQFVAGDFGLIICHDNTVKIAVNSVVANTIAGDTEQTIMLKTRGKTPRRGGSAWHDYTVPLFIGMQLVAIRKAKKYDLIKTNRAKVIGFTDAGEIVIRTCHGNTISVTRDEMYGLFDLGYVINSYNAQSDTYDFKHIIIQDQQMDCRDKYVVLTRASALKLIYIATCQE